VFHVKHEGSPWEALSESQREALRDYEDLLRTIAVPRRMVSSADVDRLHERHVLDSLRGVPWLPRHAARACDVGSGAGLPGVPIAVAEPGLEVTLSEPRLQRVAFLELVVERLGLANVVVQSGSGQELPPGHFDACFARALADPARTWAVAGPLLAPAGRLLYWAGRTFGPEDVPKGVRVQVEDPPLESGGPIVIMTRQ
jgi:16S rRNA (guanine527-N7)-methyltransferase